MRVAHRSSGLGELLYVGLAAVLLGGVFPAGAQERVPVPVPSTAQPGTAERQLKAPPEAAASSGASIVAMPIEPQAPPSNAAALSFTLRSLNVDDSHALSEAQLVQPYAPLLGQTITVDKVYAIANELTARYRNAGFFLSSVIVPPQSITDGNVRLRAVEGYIADISVEGAEGHRDGLFKAMARSVLADRPLRNTTLERYLLLINDLPGMTAQSVLRASQTTPGASELVVRLRTSHVGGTVSGSNRGSRVQGPVQVQTAIDLDSVLGLEEDTTFQYLQAIPAPELRLYSFSHSERLTASGLELRLSGSHSESDPALAAELAALNLATNTTQGSTELEYPLIRTREANLSLRTSFTYNDSQTQSLHLLQSQDKLSAVRIGMRADYADSIGGVSNFDLEFSRGIHAFGASEFGDRLASRFDGRPEFSKVTLYLARLQSLGGGFSALIAGSGQFAFNHLLLPEVFAYGGEYLGRAYDASELVGDSGAAGKLELRYTREQLNQFGWTAYVFGEEGEVWNRLAALDKESTTQSAVSAGVGVRWSLGSWLSGYVEADKPVNHIVASVGNERVRVFGGLQVSLR